MRDRTFSRFSVSTMTRHEDLEKIFERLIVFWRDGPRIGGSALKPHQVHSESVRYIMVIFECIIVLASVTDIIINRSTTFLLTSIAVSVDIFSKR